MSERAHGTDSAAGTLLDRDLSRLLKAAVAAEAPAFDPARVGPPATLESARPSLKLALPAWCVAAWAACLAALAILALLGRAAPGRPAILRALAVALPLANLVMSPVAALAIVVARGRSASHAQ